MNKFLKERSKILLVVSIISLLMFILIIPSLISNSSELSLLKIILPEDVSVTINSNNEIISMLNNQMYLTQINLFTIFATCMMGISSIFNIIGFIYKKYELNIISIGLNIIIISISSIFDKVFIILLILFLILNIIGYIAQLKINKKLS